MRSGDTDQRRLPRRRDNGLASEHLGSPTRSGSSTNVPRMTDALRPTPCCQRSVLSAVPRNIEERSSTGAYAHRGAREVWLHLRGRRAASAPFSVVLADWLSTIA